MYWLQGMDCRASLAMTVLLNVMHFPSPPAPPPPSLPASQRLSEAATRKDGYIKPCSAIDSDWPWPTMMWSSTRTSTSAKAALRVWVRCSSARLGWTEPLG